MESVLTVYLKIKALYIWRGFKIIIPDTIMAILVVGVLISLIFYNALTNNVN